MNQESLMDLVRYSQAGDAGALEELLLWAHTPVSFLCKKLLQDAETAQTQTQEILYIISQKIRTLQDPALVEKWVIRLTIAKCLQVLPQIQWMADPEAYREEELPIAGETLDQAQTVDAVQRMVDMLPEKPRVCIMLLCCGDLHSNDIAKATGYSVDAVHKYMAIAQTYVVEQIEKYQNMGTELYPIDSLKEVLLTAMYQQRNEDAMVAVYGALGMEIPDPDRSKKRLLKVLLVLLIPVIVLLIGLNVWMRIRNTVSPEDYKPMGVSLPTMATEPEETTEPTVTETTEETTPETKPQAKEEKKDTKPAATEATAKATEATTATEPTIAATEPTDATEEQAPGETEPSTEATESPTEAEEDTEAA